MYFSVKVLIDQIIIAARLVLPKYAYKEDARRNNYLDYIWGY